jgi:Aspartyl protease
MKFPYTRLPNKIKRPIIRIAVEHKGKEIPYFGLIDSGADMNLFHAEIAELLGLDLKAGVKQFAGGIVEGERREYYVHNITLKIGGWRNENVREGFMPSLSKNGHGLLGQYGFFDLYSVKFDLPKGEIELKEHAPLPYQ